MFRRSAIALIAALMPAFLASPAIAATQLTGAGSTFDFPFFSRAFYEYSRQNAEVTVNYQSIGSGGGIQQFIAKTVDFGASDVPMNAEELRAAENRGQRVLQVPVTLGGVAIAYNIPGVASGLKLTRGILVDIYLGKITKWNDPAIGQVNKGTNLPDTQIVVVHRSDGSGTTYIFTDFLSHVSGEWQQRVGTGKSVQWPVGIGGKGNEGVAGSVKQIPGSIGYLELAYVLENKIDSAQLQNRAGHYVTPTIASIRAAAQAKQNISPTDFSIVDGGGADAYPISGFSWIMVYGNGPDKSRARMIHDVVRWLVTDGQRFAEKVRYVPLPASVQKRAETTLQQMQL